MNRFLIPANTKKGQLILSIFRPIDLGIFVTGVFITFILLIVISQFNIGVVFTIMAVFPGLLCSLLVLPIPNYHNVLVAIQEIINYYTSNRNYKWRGWCAVYESKREQ